MAAEIPVFPKASTISIHSGNIVNWNILKQKPSQGPTEELLDCISSTLTKWKEGIDVNEVQYKDKLVCANEKFVETLNPTERGDLKLTVKIFLQRCDTELLKEIIESVFRELETSIIETILIAFPENILDADQFCLDDIKPIWETMEMFVQEEKVYFLGVSEMSKVQIEQLHDWAQVKPTVNQVNLASCCVMPPDLVKYAGESDIQLLTHNDPKSILQTESFQKVIGAIFTTRDAEGWEPQWTARYSCVIKGRGVIRSKGYIMKAARDLKKRK
ncbi:glutamate--cysteine ligase regulatory subunit-like [Lineus longissimus]|uniref:glutamate--cysteine ligase regulatory subunit-like n=1 Tax=Lineus longissimus TaxID=88925 RepID=UPI002B4E9C0E